MKKLLPVFLPFLLLIAACLSNKGGQVSTSGGNNASGISAIDDVISVSYAPTTPYAENGNRPDPDPVSGQTAFDYFASEGLAVGWNMGNTLDSYSSDRIGNEAGWGNPRANQALMDGVKAAGFDIIRIPITWMGNIGDAPDYRITTPRLKRVADVVELANNAGLKVIINLHHDGSTSSQEKEEGWLSIRKAYRSDDDYFDITRQYTRVWIQIAQYFKNYGDWLMFEPFNELHDGGWGWSDAFKSNPRPQLEIINQWNQLFVDIVRQSGGNNAERYLIIPAYCTQAGQTLADTFVLPTDTIAGRQIVSFHYYDPSDFGINGRRPEWGTDADKAKTDNDFAPFKPKFIDNNIPVIIGESGAVLQLYPNNEDREERARQSRREYLSHTYSTAKKYGLVPIYWDNGSVRGSGEKFGLLDRNNGQPNSPESEHLIKIMINAAK